MAEGSVPWRALTRIVVVLAQGCWCELLAPVREVGHTKT